MADNVIHLAVPVMTAAEFRVTRERLGLPLAWVAAELGVVEKTVSRWESGERTVSSEAANLLTELHRDTNRIVMQRVAGLADDYRNERDGVLLFTYRLDEHLPQMYAHNGHRFPASWHRALTGRVALIGDVPVRIAYADAEDDPAAAAP